MREDTAAELVAVMAELRVEVKHLTMAMERHGTRVDSMETRLNTLERLVERGRGAWFTTTAGIGCGTAVLVWIIEHGGKFLMVAR